MKCEMCFAFISAFVSRFVCFAQLVAVGRRLHVGRKQQQSLKSRIGGKIVIRPLLPFANVGQGPGVEFEAARKVNLSQVVCHCVSF